MYNVAEEYLNRKRKESYISLVRRTAVYYKKNTDLKFQTVIDLATLTHSFSSHNISGLRTVVQIGKTVEDFKNDVEAEILKLAEEALHQPVAENEQLNVIVNLSNEISVQTPEGIIAAKVTDNADYPAIRIDINGEMAAHVQFDSSSNCFRICAYRDDYGKPVYNGEYVSLKPKGAEE